MTSVYHKTIVKTGRIEGTNEQVTAIVTIDVYDVLVAFGVTNPATAHAIKKLLMPGQRGAKDATQDLDEARKSIVRAIEIEGGAA